MLESCCIENNVNSMLANAKIMASLLEPMDKLSLARIKFSSLCLLCFEIIKAGEVNIQ